MKFGLENISTLCAALGHPERAFQSIHIAGTNGKGSVTAMVHQALVAAGHRSARYTSPHLERLEERFVIGEHEVGSDELEVSARVVRDAIERLQGSGAFEAPPTFFESVTALAFELFRRGGAEVAVIEVGLGGRLDATNIIVPIAAAITSIDFDHEAQLGHTIESIAFEKAGIVKPGIPVVCGPLRPDAEAVIARVCAERSARLVRFDDEEAIAGLVEHVALGLRGAHQAINARIAARLLHEVDRAGIAVDAGAIRSGLRDVAWPGRLERFDYHGTDVLIDAAHNPAGAATLAQYLRETGWSGCSLVFGAMQDKNVAAMLTALAPVVGTLIATTAPTPRALDAEAAAAIARSVPGARWTVESVADPEVALTHASRNHPRVVVAGSIFLIGSLRGILRTR
jgi:dihydrofolate synthase/folylpolyglutamate synthase